MGVLTAELLWLAAILQDRRESGFRRQSGHSRGQIGPSKPAGRSSGCTETIRTDFIGIDAVPKTS